MIRTQGPCAILTIRDTLDAGAASSSYRVLAQLQFVVLLVCVARCGAGARGGGSLSREIGFRLRQQARVPRDAANRYGFSTRETLFPRLLDLH